MKPLVWLATFAILTSASPCRAQQAAADRVSFVAFGDWGVEPKDRDGQLAVRDAMVAFLPEHPVDFGLLLGDNFYPKGVCSVDDVQWKTKFEDVYKGPVFRFPFHAVLGNHDHRGDAAAQWRYARPGTHWRMEVHPYAIRYGGNPAAALVEVFVIDTERIRTRMRARKRILAKLERMLRRSRARWKVVAGHHTIYADGRAGDTTVLKHVLPRLFERYDVRLYISGHDHSMQLLRPRRRRHKTKTLFAVAGSGGRLDRAFEAGDDSLFHASKRGFLHVVATRRDLRLRFVTTKGRILYDGRLGRGGWEDLERLDAGGKPSTVGSAADGASRRPFRGRKGPHL